MIDRLNRYQRCNLTEGKRQRGKKMMLEMALYAVILPPQLNSHLVCQVVCQKNWNDSSTVEGIRNCSHISNKLVYLQQKYFLTSVILDVITCKQLREHPFYFSVYIQNFSGNNRLKVFDVYKKTTLMASEHYSKMLDIQNHWILEIWLYNKFILN